MNLEKEISQNLNLTDNDESVNVKLANLLWDAAGEAIRLGFRQEGIIIIGQANKILTNRPDHSPIEESFKKRT